MSLFDIQPSQPQIVNCRRLTTDTSAAIEVDFKVDGYKYPIKGIGKDHTHAELSLFSKLSPAEKSAFILKFDSKNISW